jgi:mRNA interferase RelE/StbE
MKVEFKQSFTKDLKGIKDRRLLKRVGETIEAVERARSLSEVQGVRKLRGEERYYRLKIGDYRLGIIVEGEAVIFVRFLHRRDIYTYFP